MTPWMVSPSRVPDPKKPPGFWCHTEMQSAASQLAAEREILPACVRNINCGGLQCPRELQEGALHKGWSDRTVGKGKISCWEKPQHEGGPILEMGTKLLLVKN